MTTAGFAYDANGNTTNLPNVTQTLAYDGENRTGGNWYDEQNQPLDRPGVWNKYGLRGERLATYTYAAGTQTWYPIGNPTVGFFVTTSSVATQVSRNIYFGGRLIQSNGDTVVTDRLGSVRVMQGTTAPEYYPYGEEVTSSANDREKFGTYTRESATGLDYANQRYYASGYGRFNTPDPYEDDSSGAGDPGGWNGYAYVAGDPVDRIDPEGLHRCDPEFDSGCYAPPLDQCYWNPLDASCGWTGGLAGAGGWPLAGGGVGNGLVPGSDPVVAPPVPPTVGGGVAGGVLNGILGGILRSVTVVVGVLASPVTAGGTGPGGTP